MAMPEGEPSAEMMPAPLAREMKFSREQEMAVELCTDTSETIVGVTGGAGTGKTTVLGKAYAELKQTRNVILCAPTGRAAKRITELTGIPAKTIHRLLEFPTPDELVDAVEDGPAEPEPRRNKFNPIDYNGVFVDEASMLGPTLYRQLMDALPRKSVIRFFGDNNQLAPVEQDGTPAPFVDVLRRFPSVELTWNYRSDDAIIGNALRILQGKIPLRNERFEIMYVEDPARFLVDMMKTAPQFASLNSQIIVPANKGRVGTRIINTSLQVRFNPPDGTDPLLLKRYNPKDAPLLVRRGDKVMWIKNDYKLLLFNGEIGHVSWIDTETGALGLVLPDREIEIPPTERSWNPFERHLVTRDPRKAIELGYAITIHKAQGSEFDTVVLCMSRSNGPMLVNRRSFYTAVTRARSRVIIITDRPGMGMAVKKRD